jgi:hypothetical protein
MGISFDIVQNHHGALVVGKHCNHALQVHRERNVSARRFGDVIRHLILVERIA